MPHLNPYKQKKIIVAFFIDFLATRDGITGGTERQVLEILQNLDKQKFDPILFCLQEFKRIPQWDNIRCEKYVIDVYSLFSLKGVKTFIKTIIYLRRRKVNIVHTLFFDSTLFGVLAAKFAGVPVILSARRDLGFWYDKQIVRKLKFINRFTSRILVNSIAIKHTLHGVEKFPLERIDVLYNGIDLHRIEKIPPLDIKQIDERINSSDVLIGIVSNFNRLVKRVDLFIKAAELIKSSNKVVKFLIVGGGKLENELKKLVKDLSLENEVIFCGPQSEVIPYMKNFHIGVLTSDSEGFSNVLLEYMACGIPSVATKAGGNIELIENNYNGFLVPTDNEIEIAEAVIKLLSDKKLRKQIGEKSYYMVKNNYIWEHKIKELENYLYQQLLLHHRY
ncbi:MAG: glycosyltransferase [Candidatus Thorarchaeota archaeon]